MAGRPVVSRGGGLTGKDYALIVFVILFLAATVGLVLQLTNVKRIQSDWAAARRDLDSYGSPPSFYLGEAGKLNGKVFDVLHGDVKRLTKLVAKSESNGMQVETDARKLLDELGLAKKDKADVALLDIIKQLNDRAKKLGDENAQLTRDLGGALEENQKLAGAIKGAKDDFEKKIVDINEQIAQLQKEKQQSLEAKDRQLQELDASATQRNEAFNQMRIDMQKREKEKDLAINRLQNQVEEQVRKIQELNKSTTFDPNAILTKSDGRVRRAIPGSDIVYISLGANDKIKVGMSFEVYSQSREPQRSLRGKASIEVVTMMDDSAECRVTRGTAGQPIIEGDIVVNIAYERNRLPKFLVEGEFDLNYDGVVDFDGVDKIKGMIRQWGGQVVEKLDETTDFVVIGAAPQAPGGVPEGVSPQVADQINTRQLEQGRFRELVGQAKSMYIPVITQNQFLFLTGYAGEGALARR